MQIHEALEALQAVGNSEQTARELAVYALQASQAGGWHSFALRSEAKLTKAEATRLFAEAGIDPDEIELPSWYNGLL